MFCLCPEYVQQIFYILSVVRNPKKSSILLYKSWNSFVILLLLKSIIFLVCLSWALLNKITLVSQNVWVQARAQMIEITTMNNTNLLPAANNTKSNSPWACSSHDPAKTKTPLEIIPYPIVRLMVNVRQADNVEPVLATEVCLTLPR